MNLAVAQEELKAVMKQNSFKRKEAATSGIINPSKLGHAKVSNLLFERPIPGTGLDYNIEILLDVSCSMDGSRLKTGIETAKQLYKLLYGVANVELFTFATTEHKIRAQKILSLDPAIHWNSSEFAHQIDSVTINGKNHAMEVEGNSGWESNVGTWELASVLNSTQRLEKKGGNTITILIGDGHMETGYLDDILDLNDSNSYVMGQPTELYNTSTYNSTIQALEAGGANILALGMHTSAFKSTYKNGCKIDELEEVFPAVIDYMQKTFT